MEKQEKFERTEEEQKRSEEIHDKFREELLKRQLSNNEGYDKAILSLSSAGLALSLTAIRFVVPLETASYLWALKISWILFLLTVISTLVAYLVGNKAIDAQLDIAENYYLKALVSAQTEKNPYQKLNTILNRFTGIFFGVAILLVVLFVILNIKSEPMANKNQTSFRVTTTDSADIPRMQSAPSRSSATASAEIPTMQMAPGTQTKSSGQSSAGNGGGSGAPNSSNKK
ncbi:hypothetical protein [Vibrio splendidus]|uniref:hypothetical protein n=1 Tax=Vibrio splendidus TaxID=29497 RepID=UPI001E3944A0|nr:hypothetical protein [Vibrio splendidus]MCC4860137.1 hypothetical protein [Vibrio splendidus]